MSELIPFLFNMMQEFWDFCMSNWLLSYPIVLFIFSRLFVLFTKSYNQDE